MKVYLWTGSGFEIEPWTTDQYAANPAWNFFGDFNGDGRTDMISYDTPTTMKVHLSTGSGFEIEPWTTDQYSANPAWNFFGDFNGDGRTDMISYKSPTTMKVHLSTGSGFDIQTWTTDQYVANPAWNFFGDFNGDGRTDMISYKTPTTMRVHLSTGSGFDIQTWTTAQYIGASGSWNFLGDFNGDGKTDMMSYNTPTTMKVQTVNSPYPDLLTNITNPFGGTTAITYKPLTDISVYTKDTGAQAAVYPIVDIQSALYVVSDRTVSDGLGGTYHYNYMYGGAKGHLLGRGFLGFRSMQEIDFSSDKKTTTFYFQTFPHTGLPSNIETDRASDGAPFKDTIHEYFNEHAYPAAAPTVSFVASKKVDIVEQEGSESPSRTIRREFFYDDPATGNLTSVFHHRS